MAPRPRIPLIAAAAALALVSLAVPGCKDGDEGGSDPLKGSFTVDGSATLASYSSDAARRFTALNEGVHITVRSSGTAGGLERLCAGKVAIATAARPIREAETASCRRKGIRFVELHVAFDAVAVVTKKGVDLGSTNLTLDQLAAIWSPTSTIANWKDVPGGSFRDLPLALAGPGPRSSTYAFFDETVLGTDASGALIGQRQDYVASDDGGQTASAVEDSEAGLGYLEFAAVEPNRDSVRPLSVNGVMPAPETIRDGSYPFSRPLLIYVREPALDRTEVDTFVNFYLNTFYVALDRFVPISEAAAEQNSNRLYGVRVRRHDARRHRRSSRF
jgi:phosphate transport system substrate-binding protein